MKVGQVSGVGSSGTVPGSTREEPLGTVTRAPSMRFGYVPQRDQVDYSFPLKVLDVVMMGRYDRIGLGRRPTNDDRRRAHEALEHVGIDRLADRPLADLSGGQKQRIMLARALTLNPRVLLLDDFTSRVDTTTERKILENVRRNYPDITLVSVTQKVAPVEDYDQIVLLMEGEVLAAGTHQQLLESSPEYVQIYESQRSTSHYELYA